MCRYLFAIHLWPLCLDTGTFLFSLLLSNIPDAESPNWPQCVLAAETYSPAAVIGSFTRRAPTTSPRHYERLHRSRLGRLRRGTSLADRSLLDRRRVLFLGWSLPPCRRARSSKTGSPRARRLFVLYRAQRQGHRGFKISRENWTKGHQCLADDYLLQHSTRTKTESHKNEHLAGDRQCLSPSVLRAQSLQKNRLAPLQQFSERSAF